MQNETTTAAPMSPEQIAYCAARALYDSAIAEVTRLATRLAPMPGPTASDEETEAWLDASEQAYEALGVDALSDRLARAEDAMLAWSFAVARREAGKSRAKLALIAQIEAGIGKPLHLQTRRKAIDIALRLVGTA